MGGAGLTSANPKLPPDSNPGRRERARPPYAKGEASGTRTTKCTPAHPRILSGFPSHSIQRILMSAWTRAEFTFRSCFNRKEFTRFILLISGSQTRNQQSRHDWIRYFRIISFLTTGFMSLIRNQKLLLYTLYGKTEDLHGSRYQFRACQLSNQSLQHDPYHTGLSDEWELDPESLSVCDSSFEFRSRSSTQFCRVQALVLRTILESKTKTYRAFDFCRFSNNVGLLQFNLKSGFEIIFLKL